MNFPTARRWRAALAFTGLLLLASCGTPPAPAPSTDGTPLPHWNTPRVAVGETVNVAGNVQYIAMQFNDLPDWNRQPFAGSLASFHNSCRRLSYNAQWTALCGIAARVPLTDQAARAFFEQYFTPWSVSQNGQLAGTVTGYYEPGLSGSLTATSQAKFPIYGVPYDFVSVPYSSGKRSGTVRIRATGNNSGVVDANGSYTANLSEFPITERTRALKGRFAGNRFVPYYTRAEINAGALNGKAPILAYADDPVELFFLQVQGSGRLITPDGHSVRLAFADKNDFPYVSIGRYMANRGYLPLSNTDMPSIKNWLRDNPAKLAEVLGQNPSFVFFRKLPDDHDNGPSGALGVPLSAGFSAAVDKHHITLGSPLFVATTDPRNGRALNRLVMAQDTGSAITGGVRVDFFWGYGAEAGTFAGKMKHPGYVWTLLPNGQLPRHQP
ncbi:MAG: MltA domain-containing protein [Neisseria sp.]|nr:MltA domain-containing protein [Neisseria sp.]